MTKKKIERISVIHRREINWLKWFFLKDKNNRKRTILQQKIHESFLQNNIDKAIFLINLNDVTAKFVKTSDERMIKAIKEVYVYENLNVIGACQSILYLSPSSAYIHLNQWFDRYFYSTYKYIPIKK